MKEEEEILSYNEFRTGLTFRAVYDILKSEARIAFNREGRRMFVTRHTVLGRWREIKNSHYKQYIRSKLDGKSESYLASLESLLDRSIPF